MHGTGSRYGRDDVLSAIQDAQDAKEARALRFLPGNAQDVGSRAEQQDSFGFSDPGDADLVAHGGFLAVLADGMGGLQHGDAAGSIAVKTFLATYRSKTPQETIPQALERALQAANAAVLALAEHAGAVGDVGATLVAAVLHGGAVHWVSVGDSGLFLFREGALSLLTTPQVYANELDARAASGNISTTEALNDPQRQALTSYLGLRDFREVDRSVRPLPLQPGDRVVLASDGLFKTLTLDEMAAELKGDPQQACEALVSKALGKRLKDQDNVTVLSLAVEEEGAIVPPQAAAPAPARGRRSWLVLLALAVVILTAALGWRFTRASNSPAVAGKPSPPTPAVAEFVKIPAGEFQMGASEPPASPVHKVRITREFEIGKQAVSAAVWQKVMGVKSGDAADGALTKVSFDDAQRFLDKLNEQKDGFLYRLPSEAQWEYAARSGLIAGLPGKLGEWCQDWYDEKYYASSPAEDPVGPASGSQRVVRGHSSPSARSGMAPGTADAEVGFRVVRTSR